MSVAFNPFNPFSYWPTFGAGRVTTPKASSSGPIDLKARASDTGLSVSVSGDSLTLRGKANGPKVVNDPLFGGFDYARSVSFTLDIDKVPTKDQFGKDDFREKNSRLFNFYTEKGQSPEHVARALAAKVNAGDDFRATVSVAKDGAATLSFTRR